MWRFPRVSTVGMDRLQGPFLLYRGGEGKYAWTGVLLLWSMIGYTDFLVLLVSLVCGCLRVLSRREGPSLCGRTERTGLRVEEGCKVTTSHSSSNAGFRTCLVGWLQFC